MQSGVFCFSSVWSQSSEELISCFSQAESEEDAPLTSEGSMNLQSKDCFRLEGVVTGVFRVKARALAVAIGGTWPPVLISKVGF